MNDVTFIHYLSTVPTVTVAEGVRATFLLWRDTTKSYPLFNEQWGALRHLGAVRDQWNLSPDDTLDKGTLAYMLMQMGKLPRGVTNVMADTTKIGDRRYALKACIDAEILPYSTEHQPVTGGELLTALRRIESRIPPSTPEGE